MTYCKGQASDSSNIDLLDSKHFSDTPVALDSLEKDTHCPSQSS